MKLAFFATVVVLSLVWVVPVAALEGSIVVDSLGIAAPVVPATMVTLPSGAATLSVPCWEAVSAWGAGQNTVLFGHSYHPTCGGVFDALHRAEVGQEIAEGGERWVITEVLPGVQPADVHWLSPTVDPQLTLITCWPPRSTAGRLVIVARPATVAQTGSPVTTVPAVSQATTSLVRRPVSAVPVVGSTTRPPSRSVYAPN